MQVTTTIIQTKLANSESCEWLVLKFLFTTYFKLLMNSHKYKAIVKIAAFWTAVAAISVVTLALTCAVFYYSYKTLQGAITNAGAVVVFLVISLWALRLTCLVVVFPGSTWIFKRYMQV